MAKLKKVPSNHIFESKFPVADPDAVSGLIKGFTHVILEPGFSGKLDTTEVFFIKYYPSGYLMSSESYPYSPANKTDKEAVFAIKSRLAGGSRITYEYDSRANITARRMYNVSPDNSQEAKYVILYALLEKEKNALLLEAIEADGELSEQDQENNNKTLKKRAKLIIDSLSVANVSEYASLYKEEITVYDENDNPVYSLDTISQNSIRYFYTYYPNGMVKVQRSHYHSTANSGLYYSTTERHFTYNNSGKITEISTYIAELDSGDIQQEKYLVRKDLTHYNKKGLPDTITAISGRSWSKETRTYIDTLIKKSTTITGSNSENDTKQQHTVYSYRGNRVIEAKNSYYNGGEKVAASREETFYDKYQLPVEVKRYRSENGPAFENEILKQQELLFYGLATDKETEKMRLTHIKTEVPKPIKSSAPPAPAKPLEVFRYVPKQDAIAKNVFNYVEQMPVFPGDTLTNYLKTNSRPVTGKIEGKVNVKFIVNADGTISDEQVVKGLCDLCDLEALRLVRSMPKWIPGKQGGKNVNVYYTLNIPIKGK